MYPIKPSRISPPSGMTQSLLKYHFQGWKSQVPTLNGSCFMESAFLFPNTPAGLLSAGTIPYLCLHLLCLLHGHLLHHGAFYQHRTLHWDRVWPFCAILHPAIPDRDDTNRQDDVPVRYGSHAHSQRGFLDPKQLWPYRGCRHPHLHCSLGF